MTTAHPQADRLVQVAADRPGERLDVAVSRLCGISRARARSLIDLGLVKHDGRTLFKPGDRVAAGERLSVVLPAAVPAEPSPEALPLSVVYEDAELIVLDKPAGMAVHPGPGHAGSTVVNALLAHSPDLPGIGGIQRPGIVHRLDKDTSGLLLVAKTERAQESLTRQLSRRLIKKTYLALIEGIVEPPEALIEAPIGRDPNNRKRQMVRGAGRDAQTSYRSLGHYSTGHEAARTSGGSRYTYLQASPITGRTHQIRVHLASIGHAVVGDSVYGKPSSLVGRQFLHAWRLTLQHPVEDRDLTFEAPLAPDLAQALELLEPLGS